MTAQSPYPGLVERVAEAIFDQHHYHFEEASTGYLAGQHPDDIERAHRMATAAIAALPPQTDHALVEALTTTHRLISDFAISGFTDPDIGQRLFENQARIHAALAAHPTSGASE